MWLHLYLLALASNLFPFFLVYYRTSAPFAQRRAFDVYSSQGHQYQEKNVCEVVMLIFHIPSKLQTQNRIIIFTSMIKNLKQFITASSYHLFLSS